MTLRAHNEREYALNLRRFDGGEGGGESSGETGVNSPEVVYGKQPDTQGAGVADQQQETQEADLSAEFHDLVRKGGKYADAFNDRVQHIVQGRVGKMNDLQQRVDGFQPILDALSARYGESDVGRLSELIGADQGFYEDAAADAGVDVPTYLNMQRLERENAQYRQQAEAARESAEAAQQAEAWNAEAEAMAEKYPGFDLMAELEGNETFGRMLQGGVPMEDAYFACHRQDIMTAAQRAAAENESQRVQESLRQGGLRPTESGVSQNASRIVKADPSNLNNADLEEIERRVRAGQRISF